MATENTAIVKPEQNNPNVALRRFLDARSKNLVTYGAKDPQRMIQIAAFEFASNQSLRNCTPESIYTALAISAQLGLIPSSALGEAFLVPFKGKCTLIPGWKGLVKLAHRSKAIKRLVADVVYERDEFRIVLGTQRSVHHVPALRDRGDIVGAVAIATFADGETDIEWMSIEDLRRVRAVAERSRPSPAYTDWEDQMYRKAPLRRLCKRLPLGEDYFAAAAVDEISESDQPERVHEILDVPNEEAPPAAAPAPLAAKVAERASQVNKGSTSVDLLVAEYSKCTTRERHALLEQRRAEIWKNLNEADRDRLVEASNEAPIGLPDPAPSKEASGG